MPTELAAERVDEQISEPAPPVIAEPEPTLAPAGAADPATNGIGAQRLSSGRVVASIVGSIRRDDGHPVPDAVLTLIDQRGQQVSRTAGDGGGSYLIEPPAPGSYVLIVSADSYQPTAVHVTAMNGVAQQVDITVHGSGELSGVVYTPDREPVAGATVTVTDLRGEVVGAAVTTADGSYACKGVTAGTYTLVAVSDQMRPTATTLTVPASGQLVFDVELAPMATLWGTVRADGRAVHDARVTVVDWSGLAVGSVHTDMDGRYAVADLPAGEYIVVTRGYPMVTSEVTVTGGRVDHDVHLGFLN
ncbi:carboxypeptidase-like regulatory domain-containing protein [Nocardia sp. XZ_19_385]